MYWKPKHAEHSQQCSTLHVYRKKTNAKHDTSIRTRALSPYKKKGEEAQLKSELNNYLFRGLIKLRKCRFMPLKKLYKYRFNFTNICTLVYHSTVKWLTKSNKMFKTRGKSTNSQSLCTNSWQKDFRRNITTRIRKTNNEKVKTITLFI